MADVSGNVPPPYASDDPLRRNSSQSPEALHGARAPGFDNGGRAIPSYEYAVGEVETLPCPSAAQYFEQHPPPQRPLRDGLARHTLYLDQESHANDVNLVPLCWKTTHTDVTRADMYTFANYLFPEMSSPGTLIDGQICEDDEEESESWSQRKGRLESTVAEWNEGFFGPRGLHINLSLEDGVRTHYLPSDVACAECAGASEVILEETFGRKSNSRPREVARASKSPALPAWRATSSRPCCLGLLAGLAAQAVAHHAERRARRGHEGGCGRRQYKCSRSNRRRCGQNTSESTFPKAHAMETHTGAEIFPPFPSSASTVKLFHDSLPRNVDNYHDASALPEMMADMKLTTPVQATRHLQKKPSGGAGMALQDLKNNLSALTSSHDPSTSPSTPERLAFQTPLKTLKHEIKATVRQVKAERHEAASARGEGCRGAMSRQEKRELRRWKRESLGEIRDVEKRVKRAG
jgi:hypothetical protein